MGAIDAHSRYLGRRVHVIAIPRMVRPLDPTLFMSLMAVMATRRVRPVFDMDLPSLRDCVEDEFFTGAMSSRVNEIAVLANLASRHDHIFKPNPES
jgi:hypothetical protein